MDEGRRFFLGSGRSLQNTSAGKEESTPPDSPTLTPNRPILGSNRLSMQLSSQNQESQEQARPHSKTTMQPNPNPRFQGNQNDHATMKLETRPERKNSGLPNEAPSIIALKRQLFHNPEPPKRASRLTPPALATGLMGAQLKSIPPPIHMSSSEEDIQSRGWHHSDHESEKPKHSNLLERRVTDPSAISRQPPKLAQRPPITATQSSPNLISAQDSDIQESLFQSLLEKVFLEAYKSELSYVNSLELVDEFFIKPFKDPKHSRIGEVPFSQDEFDTIFKQFVHILELNRAFLCEIRAALVQDQMGSPGFRGKQIIPVFCKYAKFFQIYHTYCNDYEMLAERLRGAERRKNVSTFLGKAKEFCKNQSLAALLITPVQRIPRYRMLLEEMQKKAPQNHEIQSQVEEALTSMRNVASSINAIVGDNEVEKRFRVLLQRFTGLSDLLAPHRTFIGECKAVSKLSDKNVACTRIFLFTDVLVFASEKKGVLGKKGMVQLKVPLEGLTVTKIEAKQSKLMGLTGCCGLSFRTPETTITAGLESAEIAALCEKRFSDTIVEWESSRQRGHQFQDGSYWTGAFTNSNMEGAGTYTSRNGNVFSASFINGKINGECTAEYFSGERMKCTIKDDLLEGPGSMTTHTGISFFGHWSKEMLEGEGELRWPNGDYYSGEFKNNLMQGFGSFVCLSTGSEYHGEFQKGLFHGKGTLTTPTGTYSGDFFEGRREGKGKIQWKNGAEYHGSWLHDMRYGQGTWQKGDTIYEGPWENDMRSGEGGKFSKGDTLLYNGTFQSGFFHGQGSLQEEGNLYTGSFVRGKKEGKGYMQYSSGAVYQGEWKDDKRFGEGTYWDSSSTTKYEGHWEEDMRHGKGTQHYSHDNVFTGQWNNDTRCGEGTFCNERIEFIGNWMNNRRHGSGKHVDSIGEFVGEFARGEKNGPGTLTQYRVGENGREKLFSIDAEFDSGRMEGKAILTQHIGESNLEFQMEDGRLLSPSVKLKAPVLPDSKFIPPFDIPFDCL